MYVHSRIKQLDLFNLEVKIRPRLTFVYSKQKSFAIFAWTLVKCAKKILFFIYKKTLEYTFYFCNGLLGRCSFYRINRNRKINILAQNSLWNTANSLKKEISIIINQDIIYDIESSSNKNDLELDLDVTIYRGE